MKISGLVAFTAMVAVTGATYQPVVGQEAVADEDQFGALENENLGDEGVLEVVEVEEHEEKHEGEHAEDEHHDEAHGHDDHEKHGMFGIPWAAPDFTVGILMGAYGPVSSRARGGDCFSLWYDWGLNAIQLSNFFTQPFNIKSWRSWTKVVIRSTLGIWGTYSMFDRCVADLDEAKELHWNHYYGFKTEDVSIPHVSEAQAEEQVDEGSFTAGMVLALIFGGLSIAIHILEGYYYWGFGLQVGQWISNLIVAIDYWAETDLFHVEPAWERYLPEGTHLAAH